MSQELTSVRHPVPRRKLREYLDFRPLLSTDFLIETALRG